MNNNDNIVTKILYGIGVATLYIIGIVLVLSSGCFVFYGLTGGSYTPIWIFVPVGLILGVGAYFLIRYLVRLHKTNNLK